MQLNRKTFLIIDHIPAVTRRFTMSLTSTNSKLVVAGNNTRHLLRMMYDHLIEDYTYCDFNSEISVAELKQYVSTYHHIDGLYLFADYYQQQPSETKQLITSLHKQVFLIKSDLSQQIFTCEALNQTQSHITFIDQLGELTKLFQIEPTTLAR